MNKRSIRILELNKIIDLLIPYADSPRGKRLCKKMKPLTDPVRIETMQQETSAALTRLYKRGGVTFSGVSEIGESIKRMEVQASLSASELLDIARLLDTAAGVQEYGHSMNEEAYVDCLTEDFDELLPLTHLSREIHRCILSADEIADDASAELKNLRRQKKQMNGRVHNELMKIINNKDMQALMQDSLVTLRNGRYCIPVKQEYKNRVPGMIHDQSSSGSTLFIEPLSVVNLNNELKELENLEQIEIDRILAALSEQAAFCREDLLTDLAILTKLDFIFARGKYAKSYMGTQPLFNTEGRIRIKQGRHPLLDSKKVVPIDLVLGQDYNMLIVTGPNTGGKTVSLKTLGLFTLMGQCGLHIPAFEGSELAIFQDVFADIGDEQSIEQNLSTFSSHMSNIVYIMEHATADSLVLFDELGGGTDPVEGAALAIAILDTLHKNRVRCMATTHYSELKTYALSTEGIENASCEFDLQSLQPTYHLTIGIPGKSNAFAISKKLGLSPEIIEDARTRIDSDALDFENLITDLEHTKRQLEDEEKQVATYKQEIEALHTQLKEKQESIDSKRRALLEEAREEAKEIVEDAKAYADQAIRQYQRWQKNPNQADNKAMERERTKLRERADSYKSKKKSIRKSGQKAEDFAVGDTVYIISMDTTGTVLSLPNAKGEISVQAGILHMTRPITDCEIEKTAEETKRELRKPTKQSRKLDLDRALSIQTDINVIGLTVDEAISKIDKYLDDALLANLNQVTIIHGKGTGALRNGIHDYLKKQPHVAQYRRGEFGEGDMGVTVVTLQ